MLCSQLLQAVKLPFEWAERHCISLRDVLTSNIPCTVKSSQYFAISWGQISLALNTNGDSIFVSARCSWKPLYTVILVFHLSCTHSLAKGRVFNHWCYFLQQRKSKFAGNLWPQIALSSLMAGVQRCVEWSGNLEHTFVGGGLWFLVPSEAPALQRPGKFWAEEGWNWPKGNGLLTPPNLLFMQLKQLLSLNIKVVKVKTKSVHLRFVTNSFWTTRVQFAFY